MLRKGTSKGGKRRRMSVVAMESLYTNVREEKCRMEVKRRLVNDRKVIKNEYNMGRK